MIRAVAAIGVALVASLALARTHPFGDAGLYASSQQAQVLDQAAPARVREVLQSKCADCHSTVTHAPVYGRFAPVSWLMERDIVKARKAMNLSRWQDYSAEEQEAFKSKILLETRSGKMPVMQYRIIHWNSRITGDELGLLAAWAKGSSGSVATTAALAMNAPDPARGKDVFERRCTGCHSLTENREGPRLGGVYGRVSGTAPNFGYSAALRQAHITWDEKTLEQWLAGPDEFVPGVDMDFHVAKPQERVDVIRFLKESAAK